MIVPKQMASGRIVDLAKLTARDVYWPDIADGLARICRFDGALKAGVEHYSVAEHCCRCHDAMGARPIIKPGFGEQDIADAVWRLWRLWRLSALLHDAHEAYIGDLSTPAAGYLAHVTGWADDESPVRVAIRRAKETLDLVICGKAGLARSWIGTSKVKLIDERMLATERRDLLAEPDGPGWPHLPQPYDDEIRPWRIDAARDGFLLRLREAGVWE